MRAERAHFKRGDRELEIINRAGWRCEVKNVINFFFRQKNEIGNIMLDEPEILVPREMSNIRGVPRDQIIDGNDAMTFRQKSIHQMRAEKTRAASDDRNRLGTFCGHCAILLMGAAQFCQKESQSE